MPYGTFPTGLRVEHLLPSWFRRGGNFRRWGPVGGSRSWAVRLTAHQVPSPSLTLLHCREMNNLALYTFPQPWCSKSMGPRHGLNPLEL